MAASLYFIMDGSGNYYRSNSCNQLVAVESRDYAGVFSFAEANQRIGGGKKAHFYSVVPVEDSEESNLKEEPSEKLEEYSKENEKMGDYVYDMRSMDWQEYLNHFCYLAAGAKDYQEELKLALSDLDMQICDIMHYIELYDLNASDSVRMVELLKECREQRRDVKDEMTRVECFQKSIGTSANIAKVKDNLAPMKKMATRIYHPRKLPELFVNCPEETVRRNKLVRAMADTNCMADVVEDNTENMMELVYEEQPEMEAVAMEYTKQETIFDGKENNWLTFAKQQAEFYANAEQYIVNLQVCQGELQDELEQILEEIENANYNVTQGYNVYKRLKELRGEKKRLEKELEAMYILTYGIDCNQVAENMMSCVEELEELFPGQVNESVYEAEIEEQMVLEPMLHEVKIAG